MLALGEYMSVQCHSCIGGKSIGEDIRRLDYGVHVVSGTPGRVFDMIQRQNLRTRGIKTLVLDEADEMLSKGFKEQIYDIYRYLPPATQARPPPLARQSAAVASPSLRAWPATQGLGHSRQPCADFVTCLQVILISATMPHEVSTPRTHAARARPPQSRFKHRLLVDLRVFRVRYRVCF